MVDIKNSKKRKLLQNLDRKAKNWVMCVKSSSFSKIVFYYKAKKAENFLNLMQSLHTSRLKYGFFQLKNIEKLIKALENVSKIITKSSKVTKNAIFCRIKKFKSKIIKFNSEKYELKLYRLVYIIKLHLSFSVLLSFDSIEKYTQSLKYLHHQNLIKKLGLLFKILNFKVFLNQSLAFKLLKNPGKKVFFSKKFENAKNFRNFHLLKVSVKT